MDADGDRDAGSKGRLRMTGGDTFAQRGGSGSIRRDFVQRNTVSGMHAVRRRRAALAAQHLANLKPLSAGGNWEARRRLRCRVVQVQ